jgi:16S rRNA (cytosine1402-N4)-methyltransferase
VTSFHHEPVMVTEIVALFAPVPPGWIVDATVGGGGHAAAILERRDDLTLLGIDQDPAALQAAGERLSQFGDRVVLHRGRFDRLNDIMSEHSLPPVSGVLFDLGVSSPQLDRPERGFSYSNEAKIDMRMDPDQPWSGADVVNGYDKATLAALLRANGDERFADRVATAIVAARPIDTTVELAEIIRTAIPAATRRRGGHPAKRAFQAIRIEVNRELAILPRAVDTAIERTAAHGRIVALAYHSGEDRVVKGRFRQASTGGCTCPPALPCVCDAVQTVRVLRPGGWKPTAEEVARNPRSASAHLRAVEKLQSKQ